MYAIATDRHHSNLQNGVQCSLSSLIPILLEYLTTEEELQIHQQFLGSKWRPNSQVLWSGILREEAQKWADEHEMQTLTTAMGPLMDTRHPLCLKKKKSSPKWSGYVKGASAVFAWYITRGQKVTVLSPPPPERFHPSGLTNYQAIEEPILKWAIARGALLQIVMVHPTVKGAENFSYRIWPVDETASWNAVFGTMVLKKLPWRTVKVDPRQMALRRCIEAKEVSGVRHETSYLGKATGSGMYTPSTGMEKMESMKATKSKKLSKTSKGQQKMFQNKVPSTNNEQSQETGNVAKAKEAKEDKKHKKKKKSMKGKESQGGKEGIGAKGTSPLSKRPSEITISGNKPLE